MTQPIFKSADCTVYHGDAMEIMSALAVDCLIGDPPYSDRTHNGHNDSDEIADRTRLSFDAWNYDDVMNFVDATRYCVDGWRVIFSDHILQYAWERFFAAIGLYTFAPIPYVAPGGRVRLSGDGPACWATWLNIARPKEGHYLGFGSLPGAYVLPPGNRDKNRFVGGKELWIMRQLINDYSRPGNLILDPVCGSGTTLIAALEAGRKCIGIDLSLEACEMTVSRIEEFLSNR
jgi:site-specific DNA-methyltransferase (adenine-specific)